MMHKLTIIAAAAAMLIGAPADAQTYPSRPITIIVPFAAGGPTDHLAHIMADGMGQALGQKVVVENVTGGGGTFGVARAVKAAPDGYTLSIGHLGTHVVNGAIYPLSFDLINDLDPVSLIGSNPMLIVSKNAVPAKTLPELVSWIRAHSGNASAGTAGIGSGAHFSGVYFEHLINAELQFIPYRGTGPALKDMVAGQIDLMIDQASNSLPYVEKGAIRAYAVTADKRLPALPNVPTVDEAGLPKFHVTLWSALWVPKGTAKEIVARLDAAVVQTLADPTIRKRMSDLGLDIYPREMQTPEALRAFQRAEVDKWWPIIKAAKIKPE